MAKLDPGLSGSASLLYSSYLGGSSQDEILAIAVDGAGLTYLTGYAQSSNFPTLNPLQASRAGGQDVVLVKLDLSAVGTASLLYATYLGGSSTDRGQGIGLDAQGKVYLTGFTQSANFPTANALQPALGGGRDALAVKIDLASNSLVYATYLGGGGEDQAGAIAVDGAGNAHLTGFAESVDFPVANAIQASKGAEACSAPPCQDAFVARLDPSGSLLYSTYLGGGRDDFANGIALDESGAVYLTGATFSADFPTTPGSYSPTPQTTTLQGSKQDLFVAKISAPQSPGMAESYTWHYAYDGLSRLVSACSQWDASTSTCLGESFSYSYDGAGNALSFSRWGGSEVETVSFVYNGANQIACRDDGNGLCGDAGDIAYSYDAYGNLTHDGIKSYAYDAENRLVSVTDGASTTSYTYNGDGERMAQTVDGVTTSYVLDTATPLTMVLAETTGAETIYYLHGLDLVAQSDGVTVGYFGYDGLGSVRQVLDGAGNVLFAQVFDPYGNEYASVGVESTSFGFTGEQTDRNGLVYLRARYYNPRQGRFLQRDPWRGFLQSPGSITPYLYVEDNPVSLLDPSGMWTCRGHTDCKDWVENVLNILSITSLTGREIVDFFHEHDEKIKSTQPGSYLDPSCQNSPLLPSGVLIEFGRPWPGPSWGTAVFLDILQLSNDTRVIKGPNPEGFGLQLFGHEVSHWAQGSVRLTIQGELLARYFEKQLRTDLKPQYGEIAEGESTDSLVTLFNPFYLDHLRGAKDWMIEHWGLGYAALPLPSVGRLDQSWLEKFYIDLKLPDPPSGPSPAPTPPPSFPPVGTPEIPPKGTPTPNPLP